MKRCVAALFVLAAPVAHASPDLADAWSDGAAALSDETTTLMAEMEGGGDVRPDARFAGRVLRFSATAERLGRWSDQAGLPAVFGDAYRELANDADNQLQAMDAAQNPSQRYVALRGLSVVLDRAPIIAAASARPAAALRD